MAQFIQLTSWQQFLQKASQKNAPPLHSCKFFFHISLRFKPSKSHTPNCTWFTEKTSELWLPPVIPSSISQAAYPASNNPNQPGTPPNLEIAQDLRRCGQTPQVFRCQRGPSFLTCDKTCKTKSQPCWFGSVSKNINMSINEKKHYIKSQYIYIYIYV